MTDWQIEHLQSNTEQVEKNRKNSIQFWKQFLSDLKYIDKIMRINSSNKSELFTHCFFKQIILIQTMSLTATVYIAKKKLCWWFSAGRCESIYSV